MGCACCEKWCCPGKRPLTLFATFQNLVNCPNLAAQTVTLKFVGNNTWTGSGAVGGGLTCNVTLVCFTTVNPQSSCFNQTSWQVTFDCGGTPSVSDHPPDQCGCHPVLLSWVSQNGGGTGCCGTIPSVSISISE